MQRRRDVVRADAERRQHDRGVVDGVQQSGHLVVAVAQEVRRRRRRRRQHHGVRGDDVRAGPHGPAPRYPLEPVGRCGEPEVHSALAQRCGQRTYERRHAPVERPEERRPVGVGSRHLGAQRSHETAPALGGRQQRRVDGGGRHVVDRAGVDAADERIDQRVDDTPAELVRHEGADGTVADRPAGVGPGQHGVAGEAERAAQRRGCRSGPSARTESGSRARAPRATCAGGRGTTPTRRGRRSARARPRAPPRGTSRRPRAGGPGSRRDRHRRPGPPTPRSAAGRRGATRPRAG